ncbi:MAG: GLUG motif-containing protein, partial [Christensenellales bacterium]
MIVPQSACEIGGVAGWVDGNVQKLLAAGSMDIFPDSRYQIFEIGGLVGGVDDDVSDCYSTVDVVGLGDNTITFGGVAGTVGGSVTRCFATGNVQAWRTVGGVAGMVGTRGGSLTDCVALNGAVSGTESS